MKSSHMELDACLFLARAFLPMQHKLNYAHAQWTG